MKIYVGTSNLFFKLTENGVFVWLPNVVQKAREAQIKGGYRALLEIKDKGTGPKKFEQRCYVAYTTIFGHIAHGRALWRGNTQEARRSLRMWTCHLTSTSFR